jgi:2-desacetyl-2-hydroxyethyl bacteriochlorophyllide A dehydrogenase
MSDSENPTLVFPAVGEVDVVARERPDPGAGEVVVETGRSLVSTGTELTILSGDYPEGGRWDDYADYPFDAGYSNVGEVVAVGADVSGLAVGDRVASRAPHARYAAVDAERATPLPDAVDDEAATFFALAAVAMNGVRRGEVDWGEAVAVFGAGLIGQLAARFARVAGARPVVVSDPATDRLGYLPAEPEVRRVDPRDTAPRDALKRENRGHLADVVVEATGNPEAVPNEIAPLREQGRLVILSTPRGDSAFDFGEQCNWGSYRIVGAHENSHAPTATPRDPWSHDRHFELFFDLVADGRITPGELITHRTPLSEAPGTYESLLADRSDALGVVIEYP